MCAQRVRKYDRGISGCIDFQGVVDAVISPNGRDFFILFLLVNALVESKKDEKVGPHFPSFLFFLKEMLKEENKGAPGGRIPSR